MSIIQANWFAEFSESLIHVLGHSVWQAAVVAAVVWIALRALPARRAELRYGIAAAGLASVILLSFATWSILHLDFSIARTMQASSDPSSPRLLDGTTAAAQNAVMPTVADTTREIRESATISPRQVITMALFVCWILVATSLLAYGLTGVATVRYWATNLTNPRPDELMPLELIVREFCQRLKLRRTVRLQASDCLSVPAVIGVVWPVILVPVSMLTAIPVVQWRIIIAHELAHVRRWDPLVAIVQMVVESLLFFNPAVWWLSRQLRIEREACCDAVAAQLCGQPLSVARTLVEVAAESIRQRPARTPCAPATALAFAEPSHPSDLTDRVQRLVQPERTPRPRVSWVGLISMLIVLASMGIVLLWSSDLAVRAAANWMSPKDRIERLVQLEAQQNGNFVPMDDGGSQQSDADRTTNPTQDQAHSGGRVPVELIVRTDDGSPLPHGLALQSVARVPRSVNGTSVSTPREPTAEYRLMLYYLPCRYRLGASCPGWAPVISPIHSAMLDGLDRSVELVLTKGRTVEALIQEENGRPIPDAVLQIGSHLTIEGSSTTLSVEESVSAADGRVQLPRIGPTQYAISIRAPGFQRLQMRYDFGTDRSDSVDHKPLVLTMKPAHPSTITVIDAVTDKPVNGVRFAMIHRQERGRDAGHSFSPTPPMPSPWTDYAISNADGVATFDQLEDEMTFTFAAISETHALSHLTVNAGEANRTIKLPPPVVLSGQITGHLERLPSIDREGRTIQRLSIMRSVTKDYSSGQTIELDDDGRFSIKAAIGEKVTLVLPDQMHDYRLNKSIVDLEFEISATSDVEPPTREVILRVRGTVPDAPARGTVQIHWRHPSLKNGATRELSLPLQQNEVRFSVPIGAVINVLTADVVGYRIDYLQDIQVINGAEPQVIDAEATATGGVYGPIVRFDGSVAEQALVEVIAVKLPRSEKNDSRLNTGNSSGSSQYMRSVPLGGRYRMLAREQTESSFVWGISDEVTVDEKNPVVRAPIQLAKGRDVRVHIVNPQGAPVSRQPVRLEIGFTPKSSSATHSFSVSAETTADGYATFRNLAVDGPVAHVRLSWHLIVPPVKFRGLSQEVDPRRPIEIPLKSAVTASGVLVDSVSGKPIPLATVRITPREPTKAAYRDPLTAMTDEEGKFHFENLEPITYRGRVTDASDRTATVVVQSPGGYPLKTSTQTSQLELTGGSKNPVRWEATIPGNGAQP